MHVIYVYLDLHPNYGRIPLLTDRCNSGVVALHHWAWNWTHVIRAFVVSQNSVVPIED